MTNSKKKTGLMILIAVVVILSVGMLFIISLSGKTAKKEFILEQDYPGGAKLKVTATESLNPKEASADNAATTTSKHMIYDIDVFSKSSDEKISSLKLAFDYFYSPENNQTEIKNSSSEIADTLAQWNVEDDLVGITGEYTDLSSISHFLRANSNMNENILTQITITADQNGNAEMMLNHGINLDDASYDEYYNDFTRKAKAANGHADMLEELYPNIKKYPIEPIQNLNISCQTKEYQTEPFKIKASSVSTKENVTDFYTKQAEHQIYLKTLDEEDIGSLDVTSMLQYSQSQAHASGSISVGHRSTQEGWTLECKEIGKTGDASDIYAITSEVIIKNNDQPYGTLLITTTLASDGTLLLKPIYGTTAA